MTVTIGHVQARDTKPVGMPRTNERSIQRESYLSPLHLLGHRALPTKDLNEIVVGAKVQPLVPAEKQDLQQWICLKRRRKAESTTIATKTSHQIRVQTKDHELRAFGACTCVKRATIAFSIKPMMQTCVFRFDPKPVGQTRIAR